jgi:Transposase DDE domain group 1
VSHPTTTPCVLFPGLFDRPLLASFDRPRTSSDGGAILLRAVDRQLGLIDAFASQLLDERQRGKVRHGLRDLITQRVMGLACGYPDGNDAARLADDPVHKLLADRHPIQDPALASQPTLSRFENSVDRKDLFRLGEVLLDHVVQHHGRRRRHQARLITIDLDATDDQTHGGQQLSFFNTHYDGHCFLPLLGFLTFDHEPEQYLFATILRAGNAPGPLGTIGLLRRLLPRLRRAFPHAHLRVRLDGGFSGPAILEFLEAQPGLTYVVGLAKNAVLLRAAEHFLPEAWAQSLQSEQSERVYGECLYQAGTWTKERRVILKAEVVRSGDRSLRDNPRFVVTNIPRRGPRWIYERIYCKRGDSENRIKELKADLALDRTSCSSFWANQFRLLLTAVAYVLLQELRRRAAEKGKARPRISTLRDRFLKLGVEVVVSVRRIVLHFPESFPHREAWIRLAGAFGASSP